MRLLQSFPVTAAAAAALGVAALVAACSGGGPADEPAASLVVVCIDTLRADHVGAYGYARATTPWIDQLARGGGLFASAHAHSNWTVPSTASLLTSLYPAEHGAGIEGAVRLLGEGTPILPIRDGVETLATRLRRAGFRTGLFSANPYLFGRFESGFETAEVGRKDAAALTSRALGWLDRAGGDRFFLYLQYMDLHQPVEPPPPYFDLFPVEAGGARGREHTGWSFGGLKGPRDLADPAFRRYRAHREALYDGALRYVDEEVRRLSRHLERSGRARRTLVVVTSDHGEELWDHALEERAAGGDPRGFWGVGHGHTMYEELLRVPLVFHGPGVAPSRRPPCAVRQVDVVPTVLELLGLPPPAGLRGRSLAPLLRGDGAAACAETPLVAESPAYGPDSRAVIFRGRKLVARSDGVTFLFDLRADPGERRNLAASRPRLAAALQGLLRRELGPAPASRPRADGLELDDATRRDLRALGYLR